MKRKSLPQWIPKEGIPFSCTKCGECCKGDGKVHVTEAERKLILDDNPSDNHLAFTTRLVLDSKTRWVQDGRVPIAKIAPQDTETVCWFLNGDNACAIQHIKPSQCVSYPAWPEVMASLETLLSETRRCEGFAAGAQNGEKLEKSYLRKMY